MRQRGLRSLAGRLCRLARGLRRPAAAAPDVVGERHALVLQAMSVGIWDWDLRTGAMYASPRFRAIVGRAPPPIVESIEMLTEAVHPDDRAAVMAALRTHLLARDAPDQFDMTYRVRGEAGYRWFHGTAQGVWNERGRPVRLAGSLQDVTRRTELEAELTEKVEKLRKTNKDFDEFTYAASHDLKAPLRVIDNTSQWLMEDLEPHLTPETRENLALLRSRVKRMEKLLGDLLEYARIGRTRDERYSEVVKGGDLLENVVELVAPERGFLVMADSAFRDIVVMRMPLQQVLMNLIGNAIKHHDRSEGTITLGMEDQGTMYAITVEDDGPGIAGQFHERIFEMFRTLRPRDQVEGSGMGLAMVRKNVEMFGGRITLDSSPGQGARFRFTWPKLQPERLAEA